MERRDPESLAEFVLKIACDGPREGAHEDPLRIDPVALYEALHSTLDAGRLPGPRPGDDSDHPRVAFDQMY